MFIALLRNDFGMAFEGEGVKEKNIFSAFIFFFFASSTVYSPFLPSRAFLLLSDKINVLRYDISVEEEEKSHSSSLPLHV